MQYPDNQTNEQKLSQLMDGEWHELNPSECVAGLCQDESLRAKWSRYHMIRDIMKSEPLAAEPDLASRICAAIDDEPAYTNITAFNPAASDARVVHQSGSSSNEHTDVSVPAENEESASKSSDSKVTLIDEHKRAEAKDSLFKTGLTGFALAASVALVTVVGMNIWQNQDNSQQTSTIASVAPQTVIDGASAYTQPTDEGALPVVEFVSNTGSYWVSPKTTKRAPDEQRLNMLLSQHIENSPTANREGLLPYSRLVGYDERGLEQ